MLLGANMRYFELAAGRSGHEPAVAALDDITTWSQTASARRSVLHASHIYKLLFDRKVSEVVNPHSVVALFHAALVLGLYIFAVPPAGPNISESCIELLNLVDWQAVGHLGFIDAPAPPSNTTTALSSSPEFPQVVKFIRQGGSFSITGIALEGGYLAARRTLLHCADLMDGMGRWKSRTFSNILHIMSDDLSDFEGHADDSADEGGWAEGAGGSGEGRGINARDGGGGGSVANGAEMDGVVVNGDPERGQDR
jgi:hypothetical protein